MKKKIAAKSKSGGVTPAQFKKIALSFPEALEKPSYGSPAIFIAKKFFTRLRKDDNSLVLVVDGMEHRYDAGARSQDLSHHCALQGLSSSARAHGAHIRERI